MSPKQIATLIRTARTRIGMASEVIAESRRRVARLHGHEPPDASPRVAVIRQPERIDLKKAHELRDWANKYGVSEEELRRAVQAVGEQADRVRQHLGK